MLKVYGFNINSEDAAFAVKLLGELVGADAQTFNLPRTHLPQTAG